MVTVLITVLCLLFAVVTHADVVGDGIDDIMTSVAASNFYTVSDKTIFIILKHAGPLQGGSSCVRDQAFVQLSTLIEFGAEQSPDVWSAKNFDGSTDCASSTFSGLDVWVTLVLRHTGGNIELYVNGVLTGGPTASGNTTSLTGVLALFWNGTTTDAQFPGTIAQVMVYGSGISTNQIAAYGQSFIRGRYPTGAAAIWDFERCIHAASVDTVAFQDFSGNNRTITADNGANNTGMSCSGSSKAVKMPGVY